MRFVLNAAIAGLYRRARKPLRGAVAVAVASLLALQSTVCASASPAGFGDAQPPPLPHLSPPAAIPVKQPARPTSYHSAHFPQAVFARAKRPANGIAVRGPRMLRPAEFDRIISEARRATRVVAPTPKAPVRPVPGKAAGTATRAAQSTPANPSAAGTGIAPWWTYRAENVPGGGALMVNVGTGNLVFQTDDMAVPHKGVSVMFRRTYNSQNAAASIPLGSGTAQSLYGNGWTNTFDAHLAQGTSTKTVYDVDGARYDYNSTTVNGVTTYTSATPGQHATLVSDNACGLLWTRTDGTTYYFYSTVPTTACPSIGTVGGYAGRLYQIIGRNRNTNVTLTYTWDNGDASTTGKINTITATAESGLTTTLSFVDFNGRRLLQTLTMPDGTTTVQYGYDNNGNLSSVSRPANNWSGVRPTQWLTYAAIGADTLLQTVESPRFTAACQAPGGCYSDGGGYWVHYAGASAVSSMVANVQYYGNVNPVVSDGTSTGPVQGGGYYTNIYLYNQANYSVGASPATFSDMAGHATNWIVDGAGRVTQIQTCTVTPAAGASCPASSLLVTNKTWDANNNLTAVVDTRGAETDMAYDANGNVVAIAQPAQYQGWRRPTTLIDYDSYNNMVALCDPVLVDSTNADWHGQYSGGSDSYCTSQFGITGHPSAQYNYSLSYEPNGQLSSYTTAGGYTWQISYQTGLQGGNDYGLPTNVLGANRITQFDGSTRLPNTTSTYDTNGNIVCRQDDAGTSGGSVPTTTVMTYDALGRLTATADPDDASLTGTCTGKVAGIPSSSIVTRSTYYADGSLATQQTPSQAAASSGTVYSYDLDGNALSEAPYSGTPQNPQTATMRRWFDGMDRLVETQEPADPNTPGDFPISMRYMYDLSQNGSAGAATTLNGTTVTAHGNVFDTEKNTPTGWIDFGYDAFDAADRVTMKYTFAPCPAQTGTVTGPVYCSQPAFATRYDWDSSTLNPNFTGKGLLVATLDGLNAARMLQYDGLGELTSIAYSGDGGKTVQPSYGYDFDGRLAASSNSFNVGSAPSTHSVVYSYTADGDFAQSFDNWMGLSNGYSYYPDGTLAGASAYAVVPSGGGNTYSVNQPNLYRYAYRNDGVLQNQSFGVSNQSVSYSYTRGGRMTAQTDFSGSPSLTAQYADGHGRLSSYTTPSGTYGSFQYDALGRMTSYTDPSYAVDGETVASTFNIRGDLVKRAFSGGTTSSKPGFQYTNIQGVLVQNPTVDQWDGRTGALLNGYAQQGEFTYDTIGRMTIARGNGLLSNLSYDAESRVVGGDSFAATAIEDSDCHSGGTQASGTGPSRESSFVYDAMGQLFQDTQTSLPVNGHTVKNIRQWVWGGSEPFYTAAMSATWNGGIGAVSSYTADGIGSIDPSTLSLTISDADFDGAVAQFHNASGHSSWNATNPYNQFCISANPLPASANYIGPTNTAIPNDGSSDQSETVDSYGRAYLSRAMGFTVPDYSSTTPYSAGTSSSDRTGLSERRILVATTLCPSGTYRAPDGGCIPYAPPLNGGTGGPGDPLQVIGRTRSKPIKKHFGTTVPCRTSASGVMSAVEHDFGRFGNYAPLPFVSVNFDPPSHMAPGSKIPITVQAGPVVENLSVTVNTMNSQSMTFTTNPGHLIYPGSIMFSASTASAAAGAITFNIDISGTVAQQWQFDHGGATFEDAQWNHFLALISNFCVADT